MAQDCLFCNIANDDEKSENRLWENDYAAAFRDIRPKAPIHILIAPKQHVTNLDDLDDPVLAGHLIQAVRTVAKLVNTNGSYRVIINVGRGGGQVVDHLHIHLLGGKSFSRNEIESSAD